MWTEYRVYSRLETASPAVQSENLQNHHDVLKCKYSRLGTKCEPDCKMFCSETQTEVLPSVG